MLKPICLVILAVGLLLKGNAQSVESFLEKQKTRSFEKVYLHTDREFYFLGDTLWFSAYMVDARNNTFSIDTCNLYLELINKDGEIVQKELFLLNNGFSFGYLSFSNSELTEGEYLLRAYTDRLVQMGNEFFFSKTIRISAVKKQYAMTHSHNTMEIGKASIDFFPEGGFLLGGVVNQMVFKAYDEKNQPLDVSGKLMIGSSGAILPFRTDYNGVGRIYFVPVEGEKYRLEIEGARSPKYKLPEIKTNRAKLILSRFDKSGIRLNIVSDRQAEDYYIVFLHRGEGSNYYKLENGKNGKSLHVSIDNLKPGINRIILLNQKLQPLSERLFFNSDPGSVMNVSVQTGKQTYHTREEVKVTLDGPGEAEGIKMARLSVSVVNEELVDKKRSLDIRSYLLLDSELKGRIENPGDYFLDSESVSSARKLDLLMLTQGWSNYIWNDIKDKEIVYDKESVAGLNFSGSVTRMLTRKPFVNTNVFLNVKGKDDGFLKTAKTGEDGRFQFKRVQFYDSAHVFIQGTNYNNKSNTTLNLDYPGTKNVPVENYEVLSNPSSHMPPVSLFRQKYINETKLVEFYPDRNSKVLEEIEVVGKKEEEDDGHIRLYSQPNHSVKVEETDIIYNSIFEYMAGRFPGVQVIGDEVQIRGGSGDPLFLVDGMAVDKTFLYSISMFDVDKVEILKGGKAAIYGSRAVFGVVSIFTKKGGEYKPPPRELTGTFIKKIKGFQAFREFYSPRYTNENIHSDFPDYRTTLYWHPAVVLDGSKNTLSFFSCDNLSRYRIIVEGITTSGKICIGEAGFQVNERLQ